MLNRYNGKIHDELLASEEFATLLEVKIMAEYFRQQYNSDRPHSTLKYQTPDEFTVDSNSFNLGLIRFLTL